MLCSSSSSLAVLLLAVSSSVRASVLPLIGSRAPHFAAIVLPDPGYSLQFSSGQSQASFLFTYRNGERAEETTASLSLQNSTGTYAIATGLQFVDNWYTVNTTVTVPSASFADGEYTLVASEQYQGSEVSSVTQSFYIKHSGGSVTSASTASTASSSVSSSTSASATISSGASASSSSASSASQSASSRTSPLLAPTPLAQAQAQPGSIEQSLRSLLSALIAHGAH